MTDTMYCCVCRGNIADFYHAIHARAMAYSLLLAYRHFSSLLSSVFLLSQNWFKKDLTIESLSMATRSALARQSGSRPLASPFLSSVVSCWLCTCLSFCPVSRLWADRSIWKPASTREQSVSLTPMESSFQRTPPDRAGGLASPSSASYVTCSSA